MPKLKIAVIAEDEVESRLRSYIKKTIADWRPDYSGGLVKWLLSSGRYGAARLFSRSRKTGAAPKEYEQ